MGRIKEAALMYLDMGYNVMPLRPDNKKPYLHSWLPLQDDRVQPHEVDSWWMEWPRANVGIITGKISNLLVFDLDSDDARDYVKSRGVPMTPIAKTAKGVHIYLQYPPVLVGNQSDAKLGMDIRGEGGYVVAPPSIHETGVEYIWTKRHLWNTPMALMNQWMSDYCTTEQNKEQRQKGWHLEILEGVGDGGRNNAAASLAGRFFNKDLSVPEITEILLMWNERNDPPLPEEEIIRTVSSMGARHNRRN
jgi:hypothetical protein